MRVLVISATFPPMKSGGSDYAFRLCSLLAEAGAEVQVVTSRIEGVVKDTKFGVHPVMLKWDWPELFRLLRIARRFRPQVINLHFNFLLYHEHPMITLAPSLLKRALPGARFVTHVESPGGVRVELLSFFTRAVRKAVTHLVGRRKVDYMYGTLLSDSDAFIVLSDSHRAALSEHSADVDAKTEFIPPPPILRMNTEGREAARRRGREMLGARAEDFLLVHYGYINPEKGIETLFQSLRLLRERRDNVRVVIVGGENEVVLRSYNRPNYIRELRDLAAELGVAEDVIWTGYYPTESDLASVYLKSADACVLPFNWGVFMNNSSFAAAAAHGLPIIATRGEHLEAPFLDRENVLLCPPKDPEALAAAINSLAEDDGLRRRLGSGALALAREWFSWDRAIERTLETFRGARAPGAVGE